MTEINSAAIARILEDDSFVAVVGSIRSSHAKTVMSSSTSEEERDKTLAESWALDRLLARLREVAKA